MTDLHRMIKLFTELGIKFKTFASPHFLHDPDKHKQDLAISVESVDFNFNKEGEFIGLNTEGVNSFVKPKKR